MTGCIARMARGRRGLGRRVLALAGALGPLLALGLGCSGDHLTRTQPIAPDSLYWALELNHHAVTLSLQAPYDTLTLVATPRTSQGVPLSDLPGLATPQYKSTNLDQVLVTDGVLHAVALTPPGQPVPVVATLTAQGMTLVDTVLVRVVADTLPKLASVSIHPLPPDSAKTSIAIAHGSPAFLGSPLLARVTDSTNAPIEDPLVAIRSSDTLTASLWDFSMGPRRWVFGKRLGTVTVVASATMFGVTKADTLPYQVGWPVFTTVGFQRVVTAAGDTVFRFEAPERRVGKGAVVQWSSDGPGDTVDVTFAEGDLPSILPADLSHADFFWTLSPYAFFFGSAADFRDAFCNGALYGAPVDCDGGGNVVLTPERPFAMRVFATPGTYEYHSTRLGASSRIIVVDE